MLIPKFLILSGDGINCERETACAFEISGAQADVIHINQLLEKPGILDSYQGLALPGGFSFGDELGSGQILALKLAHGVGELFSEFVARGKAIIGICNGFQVLCKMGLFPGVGLAHNEKGTFINRWVQLEQLPNHCKWSTSVDLQLSLPVRHGEGRVVFSDKNIYEQMLNAGQIVLRYQDDINGSYQNVAGVCDCSGLVFGLMPHPEAYLYQVLKNPQQEQPFAAGQGCAFFESIVNFIKES